MQQREHVIVNQNTQDEDWLRRRTMACGVDRFVELIYLYAIDKSLHEIERIDIAQDALRYQECRHTEQELLAMADEDLLHAHWIVTMEWAMGNNPLPEPRSEALATSAARVSLPTAELSVQTGGHDWFRRGRKEAQVGAMRRTFLPTPPGRRQRGKRHQRVARLEQHRRRLTT